MGKIGARVVLVTGATSGIGRATAERFARGGALVVATGRDQRRLAEVAPSVDLTLTLDVTDVEAVSIVTAAVLDRYGGIDVVVNNAGIGLFESWDRTDPAALRRVMEVNLWGAVNVANAALPSLIARKGVLVQVASVAAKRGYARHTAYCASKHALVGWSEGLRCDLRGTGCDVVVVCPPAVRTPFFENAGYTTFDADHPGLSTMTPAEVAEGIYAATRARRRTVILTPRAKILYGVSIVAPKMVDWMQRARR